MDLDGQVHRLLDASSSDEGDHTAGELVKRESPPFGGRILVYHRERLERPLTRMGRPIRVVLGRVSVPGFDGAEDFAEDGAGAVFCRI